MVARNRVVISGTIAGSIERWSCSCDYVLEGGGAILSPLELQSWAEVVATTLGAGETDYPNITGAMGGNVNATRVDIYGYSATGPAVASGQAAFAWNGTGTLDLPFTTCVCVTKRTGLSGRSRRGRFYWPVLATNVSSAGIFTDAALWPAEFAEMLTDIGQVDGVSTVANPVVHSAVLNEVTPVTSVAVGNVPDVQRSRRDSIAETYVVAAL